MKLSPISLAMVPLLTVFSASAAVYQVVEIGELTDARSSFASGMNDHGQAVLTATDLFNYPVDLDAIDFDNESIRILFTEEQLAEIEQGIVSESTLSTLRNYLANTAGNFTTQPFGNTVSFFSSQNVLQRATLRDEDLLATNTEYLFDINNLGIAVGVATTPFTPQLFTPTEPPSDDEDDEEGSGDEDDDEDTEEDDLSERTVWVPTGAFQAGMIWQQGQSTKLAPPYQLFGGYSIATDINQNNLVAGAVSIDMPVATIEAIEEDCTGASSPVALCHNQRTRSGMFRTQNILAELNTRQTLVAFPGGYEERAAVWQVSDTGAAELVATYGFLGEMNSGEMYEYTEENMPVIRYYSRANAVNDAGTVVGESMYSDSSRTQEFNIPVSPTQTERRNFIYVAPHATIFNEDGALPIVDPVEWLTSSATDINNQNIVVGYAAKSINSGLRRKMFIYDMNTNQIDFPEDFFTSANTMARAINDQGIVVGQTEAIIASTRRSRAFMYDMVEGSFVDLNSYLPCDSGMTLIDATSINNNNQIMVTAVTRVQRKNVLGEPVVNDEGDPIFDDVARAVKLSPIANGTPSDCGVENEQEYSRKSASGSLASFFALLMLAGFRLRKRLF
jgi:uncharacterized membrane protein